MCIKNVQHSGLKWTTIETNEKKVKARIQYSFALAFSLVFHMHRLCIPLYLSMINDLMMTASHASF